MIYGEILRRSFNTVSFVVRTSRSLRSLNSRESLTLSNTHTKALKYKQGHFHSVYKNVNADEQVGLVLHFMTDSWPLNLILFDTGNN